MNSPGQQRRGKKKGGNEEEKYKKEGAVDEIRGDRGKEEEGRRNECKAMPGASDTVHHAQKDVRYKQGLNFSTRSGI